MLTRALLRHDPDPILPADGPDPCEMALEPRYRKGPSFCFDKNEDVSNYLLSLKTLSFQKNMKYKVFLLIHF